VEPLLVDDDNLAGKESRTYLAPTKSKAQVSEETTQPPFRRPRESGRKPRGSRTAIT
jgi:hypothetical protein